MNAFALWLCIGISFVASCELALAKAKEKPASALKAQATVTVAASVKAVPAKAAVPAKKSTARNKVQIASRTIRPTKPGRSKPSRFGTVSGIDRAAAGSDPTWAPIDPGDLNQTLE